MNKCLTEVFQQRDELKHISESFTKASILDLIQESFNDEYEPIRFAPERDLEISLKQNETTMRNMYANCVARGCGSKFSPGKGRETAKTASSAFKGSCAYFNKPGQ